MTEIEHRTEVVRESERSSAPVAPVAPVDSAQPPAARAEAAAGRTYVRTTTRVTPSAAETARRVVVLLFGLVEVVIGLRILLLLLNAREANALVSGILDVSQIFVQPFEGVLRTNALHASGSTLDVAAIVALVGWTVLERIVLWIVNVFRREPV